MTATLTMPDTRATMDAVRDGLADIRDRLSDIEGLDSLAELPGQLVDRATGRNRRSRWPFVALGVVAVVGLAAGVAMWMMNRGSMEGHAEDLEHEEDGVWSPGGSFPKGSTSQSQAMPDMDAQSFPASDPLQTPMSPGLG